MSVPDAVQAKEFVALAPTQLFVWPYVERNYTRQLVLDRTLEIASLSDKPRVLSVTNVLSSEECERIIEMARHRLAPSTIMKRKNEDASSHTGARTSTNTFLDIHSDPLIESLAIRISQLTQVPVERAESLQVVRYAPMQHYHAHYDFIDRDYRGYENRDYRDNRFVTALIYLNDVPHGGRTVFPRTNPNFNPSVHGYGDVVCSEEFAALRIKPKKGTVALFYNMDEARHMEGMRDNDSLHGGCDVYDGEKWAANFWFHNVYWNQTEIGKTY